MFVVLATCVLCACVPSPCVRGEKHEEGLGGSSQLSEAGTHTHTHIPACPDDGSWTAILRVALEVMFILGVVASIALEVRECIVVTKANDGSVRHVRMPCKPVLCVPSSTPLPSPPSYTQTTQCASS